MYILIFILGAACGAFFVGVTMTGTRRNELTEAYEKGRADERGRILEKVEKTFGGNYNG